jgi:zinc protease
MVKWTNWPSNKSIGGDFTSRINLNIREDKHWSYGAGSYILDTRGQRPFLISAPVQTDKTKESIQEVMKEVNMFVTDKQMTQAEFDKTKQNTVLGMAGMWETNSRVNRSLQQMVRYGLKDDYWNQYSQKVNNLTLSDAHNTAKSIIQPNNLGWFLTGDKAKILPGLQGLNIEIIEIDANGNPVAKKTKP